MKLKETTTDIALNDAGRYSTSIPQRLRYYIHDHSHAFRLQLVGSLREADVPELEGCWRTASRSVAARKICIDLREVTGMDAAGRAWLQKMSRTEGVEFVVGVDLASELPEGSTFQLQSAETVRCSLWQNLMRLFFRERRAPASEETAPAGSPRPLSISHSETQLPAA